MRGELTPRDTQSVEGCGGCTSSGGAGSRSSPQLLLVPCSASCRPAGEPSTLLTGPLSLPRSLALQLYQPKEERSLCCAELCCVLWPRPLVSYLYTVMGRSEATPPDSRPASRRMLDTAILRRADPFPLSCKSLSAPARRQLHFFTDSPLVVYGMFLAILSSGS
jgi:hypothetical protein